jgi:CRISPR-associated endonuclease/helicase Cas3
MILRAPTGSGKTDASLLWARHQIEKLRADRCVIAMPTRFTSNSLALDVDENVSETGLYHSSAWYARYKDDAEVGPEEKHKAGEKHRMAKLLATPGPARIISRSSTTCAIAAWWWMKRTSTIPSSRPT